jgi:hypothetical protein
MIGSRLGTSSSSQSDGFCPDDFDLVAGIGFFSLQPILIVTMCAGMDIVEIAAESKQRKRQGLQD